MPPILTPQRLRPRGISETRTIDDDVFVPKSPTKKPITSPIKKRVRQDSENRSTSPLKKRYISSFSIRLEEEKEIEKGFYESLKKNKHKYVLKILNNRK